MKKTFIVQIESEENAELQLKQALSEELNEEHIQSFDIKDLDDVYKKIEKEHLDFTIHRINNGEIDRDEEEEDIEEQAFGIMGADLCTAEENIAYEQGQRDLIRYELMHD